MTLGKRLMVLLIGRVELISWANGSYQPVLGPG